VLSRCRLRRRFLTGECGDPATVRGVGWAFGGGLLCGIGESQKRAAFGIGWRSETSPRNGCCKSIRRSTGTINEHRRFKGAKARKSWRSIRRKSGKVSVKSSLTSLPFVTLETAIFAITYVFATLAGHPLRHPKAKSNTRALAGGYCGIPPLRKKRARMGQPRPKKQNQNLSFLRSVKPCLSMQFELHYYRIMRQLWTAP
jgi:hypothetical protein